MKYGMWGLAILLAVYGCNNGYTDMIELKELSLDYKNFAMLNDKARDPVIYPESPKEGLGVRIKTDILSHFYFDTFTHSTTTGSQYRAVGLEAQVGVSLTKQIDLGLHHHSQHLLDRHHSYMNRFPVEDAIQLRIYLYRRKPERESVF